MPLFDVNHTFFFAGRQSRNYPESWHGLGGVAVNSIGSIAMRLPIVAVLLGALLVSSAPADAAILAVGGTQFPVSAEAAPTSATLLAGGNAVPFAGLQFAGELISTVYNNDSSNPFGTDKLTFTYELSSNATSASMLRRFTVPGFASNQTDLSFDQTSPSAAPLHITPSLADRTTADLLGFAFVTFVQGAIGPDQRSQRLVVQTDAKAFAPVMASVIADSVARVSSFAPLTAVPEPGTLVLFAAGAGAIEAIRLARRIRRHRNRS
jgi:hypothetical protein